MKNSISNTDKPLVSLIAINYNQVEVTCEFLESLKYLSYPNWEVIIVDNASPDGRASVIKERYPDCILVLSEKNLGFAGGNNVGLKHAKGDYILYVNNDTEVTPSLLEPLVETLQNDPSIGVVSPKIKYHYQPDTIQYAGSTRVHPITLRNGHVGNKQKDVGQYDIAQPTGYAHGACMLVSRSVLDEVGTMDDLFFLYYEEQDWCERVLRAGYSIWYQPASEILHKESVSTGKDSVLKTYYLNRNRILFARRNFSGIQLMLIFLYMIFVSIPKNSLSFLSDKVRLKAYYKALIWNLNNGAEPQTLIL